MRVSMADPRIGGPNEYQLVSDKWGLITWTGSDSELTALLGTDDWHLWEQVPKHLLPVGKVMDNCEDVILDKWAEAVNRFARSVWEIIYITTVDQLAAALAADCDVIHVTEELAEAASKCAAEGTTIIVGPPEGRLG